MNPMLEITDHASVRVIRMRHGKASALDLEFLIALEKAFDDLRDSTARALVLTGTGTIFSAGVDLVRVQSGKRAYLEAFLPAFARTMRALYSLEKPVVAAINGHAIAGGFVIACACDVRVLARGKSTLGVPELRVGVPFPPIAVEIVRRAIPIERLQETLYLGRTYSGNEAFERGYVDELFDVDGLLARALELAGELAAVPARSFALTKRLVRAPAFDYLDCHEARTASELLEVWSSPEALEALDRYVARTLRK